MGDARRRLALAVAVLAVLGLLAGCSRAGAGRARRASPAGTDPATRPVTRGRLVQVTIPGGTTGFHPRRATVYLPPDETTHPHRPLPVLELLHGTGGAPADWVDRGDLRSTLDRFAAAHDGRAPIVVLPDINGTRSADTECIRTRTGGDVESYLRTVVPDYVRAHYPATTDPRGWAIAGLSEGGTCAAVLALRAYPHFGVSGDFSGLLRLTVGDSDDAATTTRVLFGGSRAAYDAHDPTVLLREHRYPRLAQWYGCGRQDTQVVRDQARAATLARSAGIAVRSTIVPGRHGWSVWAALLRRFLPWFWAQAPS